MARPDSPFTRQTWFPFRNDAGAEVPAFAVMGISGAIARGASRVATCVFPDDLSARPPHYYAVNGPVVVPNGGYGQASLLNTMPWWALYATGDGTPAVGEEWGPRDTYTLRKHNPGFLVVGSAESGRVLVVQVPIMHLRGKTDSSLGKGDSGTISIYYGAAASKSDAGYNVTAYNPYGDIDATKWVKVTRVDGQWEVDATECG